MDSYFDLVGSRQHSIALVLCVRDTGEKYHALAGRTLSRLTFISDLNLHRLLRFYFSVFSLVLVSIEKIYQTLKTEVDHITKYL